MLTLEVNHLSILFQSSLLVYPMSIKFVFHTVCISWRPDFRDFIDSSEVFGLALKLLAVQVTTQGGEYFYIVLVFFWIRFIQFLIWPVIMATYFWL